MRGYQISLGETHPETLRTMNHLGLVLRYMGKLDEAELLNRRAPASFEATLGRGHQFPQYNASTASQQCCDARGRSKSRNSRVEWHLKDSEDC